MRPALPLALACIALAGGLPPRAAAQTLPPATQPLLSPELALAEGVQADEFLRDPVAAADWFRRVVDDDQAPFDIRRQATWRLARCMRRLQRPDAARTLLADLLAEPGLSDDLRAAAQAELAAMPGVEPARLMPADTLVYLEVPAPGRLVGRLNELLRAAGLEATWRPAYIAWLRDVGAAVLGGFLSESAPEELEKLEGLGIAWHNFHYVDVDGRRQLTSDVLFVLYTGRSDATNHLLRGLIIGMSRVQAVDGVVFSVGARPDLQYALADGLFVACSDTRAGAAVVQRHLGESRGPALAASAAFKRGPAQETRRDRPVIFVDWARLVDLVVQGAAPERREDVELIADMLALRQIGPLFGTLDIQTDRIELDLTAYIASADALLYRLFRTPPLAARWSQWIPADAVFSVATPISPGDRRWRDFERLLLEGTRARRMRTPPASAPAEPVDPLALFHGFEKSTQLSLADDVWRDVSGAALVWLPEPAADPGAEPLRRWLLLLDIEQADVWLRRIERGLRQLLFGPLSESPLPKITVNTPFGPIDTMTIPPTRIGVAWQQAGRRVVIAPGADTIVEFLERLEREPPAAMRTAPSGENKRATIRLDWFLRLLGLVPDRAPPPGRAPLSIRSFEYEDRIQLMLEQRQLTDWLHYLGNVRWSAPPAPQPR